jgi:hypothetical protein
MAVHQKSFLPRTALTAVTLLALAACSGHSEPDDHGANDYQVGRFRIIQTDPSGETIEIDTATGKTWRLARYAPEEGGAVSGWEPIRDLDGTVETQR